MCGIVGILGRAPVAVPIVEALRRLEYRGYDSAGVATLEGGRLTRQRAEGKLRNLEAKLERAPLGGRSAGCDLVEAVLFGRVPNRTGGERGIDALVTQALPHPCRRLAAAQS